MARGYLNHPKLTKERFIPNPFSDDPNDKVYKSGDVGRYLPDGNIEFLGRMDFQVKIRGFRIELGEIEAVLNGNAQVKQCVVIAREDTPGDKRLIAYIIHENKEPTIEELRRKLSEKLPEYMIPSGFVFLKTYPLTPNGKIDRKALPIPDLEHLTSVIFVAPRTPVEEELATIWANLLGLDQVGIHHNFFELGGHSLLATRVISRIREAFSMEFPLRTLFEFPTVAELSTVVEKIRTQSRDQPLLSIKPIDRQEQLPLSFAQRRLWFLDQLEGQSATYNIASAYQLAGKLNVEALEKAIQTLIQRHQTLQTCFHKEDGIPTQIIVPEIKFNLAIDDLETRLEDQQQAKVEQLAKKESQTPFDLCQAPLLRVSLLRLNSLSHVLLVTLHHIISDGWSMGIFRRELSVLYTAYEQGKSNPLPELSIQYADYSHWQSQWLTGDVLQSQLNYWKQQLGGALPLLDLPADHPRPMIQSYRGDIVKFTLSAELSKELRHLSHRSEATLYMTLLAAFSVLLYRYTNQEDLVIGSPIANRQRPELESVIGFFVNILALRINLKGNPPFSELLKVVRNIALDAYAHQDLPFEKLVEELQPQRSLSHSPLFQVLFVLQNTPSQIMEMSDLTLTPLGINRETAKFDLVLSLTETKQGLRGIFQFNVDIFTSERIERIVGHFQTLLEGVVVNPDENIGRLPILTATERHQILVELNDTKKSYPFDKCIHELFEEHVKRTPNETAVVFKDQQLTYRQLNEKANQVAHFLQEIGVNPDTLVGICVERSLEMIVGLLGILKSGGAYVPLDPEYPQERLAFMFEDAQLGTLLTQEKLLSRLPSNKARIVCLDKHLETPSSKTKVNPRSKANSDNLAYVIYTSGSTGMPKGVLVTHKGLSNLSQTQTRKFKVDRGSRVLQFASLSFDASIWEIVMTLCSGGRLCLAQKDQLLPGPPLVDLLNNHAITHVTLPPSALAVLPTIELPALQTIIVAGEACSNGLASKWLSGRNFFNAYGPTESTVCASIAKWTKKTNRPIIGRPIDNTQLYILNTHGQPAPLG